MESRFDGNMWQMIGWQFVCVAITVFSLGIAYPWGACFLYRWEAEHSIINGKRIRFTGAGGNLFLLYLKLYLGFVGMLLGILVLIVAFSGIPFISLLLSLCAFAIILLFGSYVLLRIKRWRIEHTEFEYRDTPAQKVYSSRNEYTMSSLIPENCKFPLRSNDLVTADGMIEYCRYCSTFNGASEAESRRLFEKAAQAVAPDSQVTMAFMAHTVTGELCACALANSKFISASDGALDTYPVTSIAAVSAQNGSLLIQHSGGELLLIVGPQIAAGLAGGLEKSLAECRAELSAK